jgi:hypothetical protein
MVHGMLDESDDGHDVCHESDDGLDIMKVMTSWKCYMCMRYVWFEQILCWKYLKNFVLHFLGPSRQRHRRDKAEI